MTYWCASLSARPWWTAFCLFMIWMAMWHAWFSLSVVIFDLRWQFIFCGSDVKFSYLKSKPRWVMAGYLMHNYYSRLLVIILFFILCQMSINRRFLNHFLRLSRDNYWCGCLKDTKLWGNTNPVAVIFETPRKTLNCYLNNQFHWNWSFSIISGN